MYNTGKHHCILYMLSTQNGYCHRHSDRMDSICFVRVSYQSLFRVWTSGQFFARYCERNLILFFLPSSHGHSGLSPDVGFCGHSPSKRSSDKNSFQCSCHYFKLCGKQIIYIQRQSEIILLALHTKSSRGRYPLLATVLFLFNILPLSTCKVLHNGTWTHSRNSHFPSHDQSSDSTDVFCQRKYVSNNW